MMLCWQLLLCGLCNQGQSVSQAQAEIVDFRVLLGLGVNLASLEAQVHKAAPVDQDPRDPRYLDLSEQPVLLGLLVQLVNEDFKDLLDHKDHLVHKDSKELLDQLGGKDHRARLDSKDVTDKQAVLDLLEVKVNITPVAASS